MNPFDLGSFISLIGEMSFTWDLLNAGYSLACWVFCIDLHWLQLHVYWGRNKVISISKALNWAGITVLIGTTPSYRILLSSGI